VEKTLDAGRKEPVCTVKTGDWEDLRKEARLEDSTLLFRESRSDTTRHDPTRPDTRRHQSQHTRALPQRRQNACMHGERQCRSTQKQRLPILKERVNYRPKRELINTQRNKCPSFQGKLSTRNHHLSYSLPKRRSVRPSVRPSVFRLPGKESVDKKKARSR